jgi:hypothetical protein
MKNSDSILPCYNILKRASPDIMAQKMSMPTIRRVFPKLFAKQICSVQPMKTDLCDKSGDLFGLKVCKTHHRKRYSVWHDFIYGWFIVAGNGKPIYLYKTLKKFNEIKEKHGNCRR